VTEVHWRIIANLGFKFLPRIAAAVLLAGAVLSGAVLRARRAACGRIISCHASQC